MKCILCKEGELEPAAEMQKWEQVVNDLLPLQPMTCNNCEKRLPGLAEDPLWTRNRIITCSGLGLVLLLSLVLMLFGGGDEDVVEEPESTSVADMVIEEPDDQFPEEDLMREDSGEDVVQVSGRVMEQLERNRAKAEGREYVPKPKPKPAETVDNAAGKSTENAATAGDGTTPAGNAAVARSGDSAAGNNAASAGAGRESGSPTTTSPTVDPVGEEGADAKAPAVAGNSNAAGTEAGKPAAGAATNAGSTGNTSNAGTTPTGTRPLQGVSSQKGDGGFSLMVASNGPITDHPWFVIESQNKLVIDLIGDWRPTSSLPPVINVDDTLVRRVRIGRNGGYLRLVLDLKGKQAPQPRFTPTATGLTISWSAGS